MNASLAELTRRVLAFRDARDWKQFHNPKDLSMVLSIEAAEVMDLFRFKSPDQIARQLEEGGRAPLAAELADVLNLLLLLAHESGVDLEEALLQKLDVLEAKYPVKLAKGRNLKYTELHGEKLP